MNNKRSTEIKVGIVSLLGIVLFILGISLGKGVNVGNSVNLKFRFPSSGGIKLTAPVVVNGVNRGSVTKIENDNGGVLITAQVNSSDDIFSDASARISILEITGGKKIEVFPGKSGQKIADNHEISGYTAHDIGDLVGVVGDVSSDLVNLIRRLDTVSSAATSVLKDENFIADLKGTVTEARQMVTNANNLMTENAGDFRASMQNLRVLSSDLKMAVQKHEPNVGIILADVKATLNRIQGFADKADTAITNIDALVLSIDKITKDLQTNGSTANRLLYDKELGARLDSALSRLGIFVATIEQHGVNVNLRLGTRP